MITVKEEEMEPTPTQLSQQNNHRRVTSSSTDDDDNCKKKKKKKNNNVVVNISSSSSSLSSWDSDDSDMEGRGSPAKKQRISKDVLPVGFLDPLTPQQRLAMQPLLKPRPPVKVEPLDMDMPMPMPMPMAMVVKDEMVEMVSPLVIQRNTSPCVKQFWKAGDYNITSDASSTFPSESDCMDRVRVHPRFLHSNATSHKWALGAFAELLDNALDEVCNGATYVHVDKLNNSKDNSAMLLVEDNGGGMTPERIRQCMSLGYSAKSKLANTIGQYGNGFKTSTMRLGADVIVFSRCKGKEGRSATQSIGMLSYTFLRGTAKEDIVVPMLDYEKRGEAWHKMIRTTSDDCKRNLETIVQWSPYESEDDLLLQFEGLKDQGTRIIIYNLWEDDQGSAELDFDSDEHDIQIRGVNRDEKKIEMAKKFQNLTHYLTYRHSLRNYAAILYLRIPPGFRIILRGKDVQHYNIINDLKYSKEMTYKPQAFYEEASKDPNMRALVTVGFIKDADYHADVQGFNVYHKNRLIKPFWRVWNAAGSDGRGVIGVLEANFVEPAHDKQGFERTIVFSRLEQRLIAIQKDYWSANCQLIGYAKRRDKNSVSHEGKTTASSKVKQHSTSNSKAQGSSHARGNASLNGEYDDRSPAEDEIGERRARARNEAFLSSGNTLLECVSSRGTVQIARHSFVKEQTEETGRDEMASIPSDSELVTRLKGENNELRASLEDVLQDLQWEKDRNRLLENKIQEMEQRLEKMDKETEEERRKRDLTEEALRNKAMIAGDVIGELRDKINVLERRKSLLSCKREN